MPYQKVSFFFKLPFFCLNLKDAKNMENIPDVQHYRKSKFFLFHEKLGQVSIVLLKATNLSLF